MSRFNGDFNGALSGLSGGGACIQIEPTVENDQGNARGGGGSLHSEKGAKKKPPNRCRCSRPVIHWLNGWRSREKRRLDGFFSGELFCFVDPFGWLDRGLRGGGCTRTINACAHDFMVNHKSPELGLNLSGS